MVGSAVNRLENTSRERQACAAGIEQTGRETVMVWRWGGRQGRSVGRLRLPGGAVFDQPIVLSRLMARYILTALIALIVIAVFTAWASRGLGVRTAIDNAGRRATLTAHVAIEPMLDDGMLTGDPQSLSQMDRIVRSQVLRGSLIRVKIWAPDGTILYSDENRLIGEKFELEGEELEALTASKTEAELSRPEPSRRTGSRSRPSELLEVYLPIQTPNKQTAAVRGLLPSTPGSPRPAASSGCGSRRSASARWCCWSCCRCRSCSRWPGGCGGPSTSARICCATPWTRPRRNAAASPATCTTAWSRTSPASRSPSAPRPGNQARPPEDAASVRAAADQVRDGVRSLRSLLVEIYPPEPVRGGPGGGAVRPAGPAWSPAASRPRCGSTRPLEDARPRRHPAHLPGRAGGRAQRRRARRREPGSASPCTPMRDTVVLEVSDDGRGLPGPDLPQKPGHLGLRALGGLAATMGASLTLSSTPGKGTVLALEMPTP